MQVQLTVGTLVRNKRTGTQASVVDITPNGLIWLSNGPVWPQETFLAHFEILPQPEPIQRRFHEPAR